VSVVSTRMIRLPTVPSDSDRPGMMSMDPREKNSVPEMMPGRRAVT
jgi:hypothetical protein